MFHPPSRNWVLPNSLPPPSGDGRYYADQDTCDQADHQCLDHQCHDLRPARATSQTRITTMAASQAPASAHSALIIGGSSP